MSAVLGVDKQYTSNLYQFAATNRTGAGQFTVANGYANIDADKHGAKKYFEYCWGAVLVQLVQWSTKYF